MQSKTHSLIETLINTFVGFIISLITSPIVYLIWDIKVTINQNLGITLVMTIISLLRGYAVRRYCNSYLKSFSDYLFNLTKDLLNAKYKRTI